MCRAASPFAEAMASAESAHLMPMRALILISSISLVAMAAVGVWLAPSLLTSVDVLLADARTESPPESQARYTRHPASAATTEIITLRIEDAFTDADRMKILLAIDEWNHVLNGVVRFHVAAPLETVQPRTWTIQVEKGGGPQAPNPAAGQPLSFTQAGFASSGGRMVVYVDHVGARDLRGIVLHELGHVLGLDHDTRGNLMSARYLPTTGQCVDQPTAEAIASRRKVPLGGLNWCEAAVPGATQ